MRKLFLHMGAQRTATSSIQSFMHANVEALLDQGVLYPFGVKRHQKQLNAVFNGGMTGAELAMTLHKRCGGRDKPVHTTVLSDEGITLHADLSPLKPLAERFDLKVIYSLRRQDLWLESWYLQNVKWQWNRELSHLTFPQFLDRREDFFWVHYGREIERIEQLVGRDNVHLSVFERDQMPGGPVETFCRMVGISDFAAMTTPPHINSSHSVLVSELLRTLPLDQASKGLRAQLGKAFAALNARLEKTPEETSTLLMPLDRRQEILAEYAAGNASVARRYFNRDQLFLDPLPAADTPVGTASRFKSVVGRP